MSMVCLAYTLDFGAVVSIIMRGSMLVLSSSSLSLSMMICDEDHGVVAMMLVILLIGSIGGEAMVNNLFAMASTRLRGMVVVVGTSSFLLRNVWPVSSMTRLVSSSSSLVVASRALREHSCSMLARRMLH